MASVQILPEWYSGTVVQILQELVNGISVSARVLIWDLGGASLCLLSSWSGFWYIAELPLSLVSRDSQGRSWSEAFILTKGSGTRGSSTWPLVSLYGETWDPGIQLSGTLIPIVLFHHFEFRKMHARVHRLRSKTAFSRWVWDPGIWSLQV